MHKNARFNIIQATGNSDKWLVIDGQREPGGYAAPGAKVVSTELTREQAITIADLKQHNADVATTDCKECEGFGSYEAGDRDIPCAFCSGTGTRPT